MRTPPVHVDRPLEGQVITGDVVDDRLRLDLDELDALEMGRVEGAPTKLEELLSAHPGSIANVRS